MKFGEKIKKARLAQWLTQKQLADEVGVAEITIRQYEGNKRNPSMDMLQKLATTLDVSLEYLFGVETINARETHQKFSELLENKDVRGIEQLMSIPEGSIMLLSEDEKKDLAKDTVEKMNRTKRRIEASLPENMPGIKKWNKTQRRIEAHSDLMDESEAFIRIYEDYLNDRGKKKVHEYTEDLIAQPRYLRPGVKPMVKDTTND